MDNYENRDEIRQEAPAAESATQTPETTASATAEASYFRAAADLCGTTEPRPVKTEQASVAAKPAEESVPPVAAAPTPTPRYVPVATTAAPRPETPKMPQPEKPVYFQPEAPKKTAAPRKKSGFWKKAVVAVLVLAMVVGGCVLTADLLNQRWEEKYQQMSSAYSQQLLQLQKQIDDHAKANAAAGQSVSGSPVASVDGMTPSQVYAQNVSAVAAISCTVRQGYASGTSVGSGFIMTADGYVVTNYHVVEGASSMEVMTHEGDTYPAELIGYDQANDVAVLKIEATDLPYVTIGSSDDLIVGDQVVAIGNPLGELTNTLTVGYVSAKERDVTTEGVTINMLQTDAAINSGNSGGPLFNMRGEVVGITTAKYSGESTSGASIEGIGFAVPIDDVRDLIDDLITHGYVTGAYLGVLVSEMNAEYARYYGLPVGAYVQEVTAGYCAEAAGMLAEDIIIAVGTYEVGGLNDLTRALRNFEPGDTTTVTVYRDGEEVVLTVTLDERPAEANVVPTTGQMPEEGSYEEWYEYFEPFFGDGSGD